MHSRLVGTTESLQNFRFKGSIPFECVHIMCNQQLLDELQDQYLAYAMSRFEFYKAVSRIVLTPKEVDGIQPRINRMYGVRDKTLARYVLKILDNTNRENRLGAIYANWFGLEWKFNGFDNSGRVCLMGREVKPDADLLIDGVPTEVKFVVGFNTYTVGRGQYHFYKNSKCPILMFFSLRMIGPNGDPHLPRGYAINYRDLWVSMVSSADYIKALDSVPWADNEKQPGTKSKQLAGKEQIIEAFGLKKFTEYDRCQSPRKTCVVTPSTAEGTAAKM